MPPSRPRGVMPWMLGPTLIAPGAEINGWGAWRHLCASWLILEAYDGQSPITGLWGMARVALWLKQECREPRRFVANPRNPQMLYGCPYPWGGLAPTWKHQLSRLNVTKDDSNNNIRHLKPKAEKASYWIWDFSKGLWISLKKWSIIGKKLWGSSFQIWTKLWIISVST